MNENINLVKILDGCPFGTKLYSPFLGDVEFKYICGDTIVVYYNERYSYAVFDREGKYYTNCTNTECTFFPSKSQRDWSKFVRFWDETKVEKFDPKTLQKFDKVLVRNFNRTRWLLYEFYSYTQNNRFICSGNMKWRFCIPYNEETKHLLGISDDCPEYYKWWEK